MIMIDDRINLSEALRRIALNRDAARPLCLCQKRRAVALLEKALANPYASRTAASSLKESIGEAEAFFMVGRLFASSDSNARRGAIVALGYLDGEHVLALLDKSLADPDFGVRCSTADALGRMGGEQVLTRLEKLLGDTDFRVRFEAAQGLRTVYKTALKPQMGNVLAPALAERALALLGKALADANGDVRRSAASALCEVGGENACSLILAALKIENDIGTRKDMIEILNKNFANNPEVEEALKAIPPPMKTQPVKPPKPPTTDDKF
jgi:HEAT repeat protein